MKTVYIIEDEEILRDLLATFFATAFPEMTVLGMTGDGATGLRACLHQAPDLAIVDIQLPDANGLEILNHLKREHPKMKILIFTGDTSGQTVKMALRGDADAIINKTSGLEELENAILALRQGKTFFSQDVAREARRNRHS